VKISGNVRGFILPGQDFFVVLGIWHINHEGLVNPTPEK
jgi:hypothetical protein